MYLKEQTRFSVVRVDLGHKAAIVSIVGSDVGGRLLLGALVVMHLIWSLSGLDSLQDPGPWDCYWDED